MLAQAQAYCNRCQETRLHTRDEQTVPHVIHLIVTLFLCGLWIPVWIIHAAIVGSANAAEPFRCSQCGQAANERTPEQAAIYDATRQWESAERARKLGAFLRAVVALAALAEIGGSKLVFATAKYSKTLPRRFDNALLAIAGRDNRIVYRFLQALSAGLAAAILMAVVLALFF